MADRKELKKELKKLLKQADYKVYTIVRHVSRSGMTRVIDPLVIINGKPCYIAVSVAEILGWQAQPHNYNGIKVRGCGMDMYYHLVYKLSRALYGDGYKLKYQNL